MRVYGGTAFGWDEHFARLGRTCAGLRLDADLDALRDEAAALLDRSEEPESLLRWSSRAAAADRDRRAAARRGATGARGDGHLRADARAERPQDALVRGEHARRAAREGAGLDEALLVTPHGRVLEGPTWTFFWVAAGGCCTPPLSDGILDSITRATCSRSARSTEASARSTTSRRRGGVHRVDGARGHADRGGRRHRAARGAGPRHARGARGVQASASSASSARPAARAEPRLTAAGLEVEIPEQMSGGADDA
jgi:hypothetical protein